VPDLKFRLTIASMTLAGLVLGIAVGKDVNTVPRNFGDEAIAAVALAEPTHSEPDSNVADRAFPNHYPMVTPEGRIEVDELSIYMRNRRDWHLMGDNYDWFQPPAYDIAFEREMAAARAQLDAELADAPELDSLAGPRNTHGARKLPVDIRGVVQGQGPGTFRRSPDRVTGR
jgi:hypothetical protein